MKKYLGSLAASVSLLIAAGAATLVGGCGSSSRTTSTDVTGSLVRSAQTGSASLTIQWPKRTATTSRVIPVASNNLIVQITFQGKIIISEAVARPTGTAPVSTLTFPSLPVGQLGVHVYAVPDTTVASTTAVPTDAQAVGTGILSIQVNKQTTLTIALTSTIVKLVIVPQPTSGTDFITYGATQSFDVEAFDVSGNTVLITSKTLTWGTNSPALFTITPDTSNTSGTGINITAGSISGDTQLTVFESESGISTSIPVSVRGPLAATKITTILPTVDVNTNGLNAGIVQFSYLGTDAAGFVIPGANTASASWSSSNTSVASIDSSSGLAIALSAGNAQGSTSATSIITLTVGSLPPATTILTVNLMTGTTRLSPNTVTLGVGTSQDFHSDTRNPNPSVSDTYTIVAQTVDQNGQANPLGTVVGHGYYCTYTAPATLPTSTANGVTSTITKVQIQSSDGAPVATITLQ